MSILIKGMGMPENCWDCPLQYDYICCSVMDDIELTDENEKKRDSNCPLEEVSCMNSEKTHDVISRQAAIDIVQGYAEQLQGYIGMPNDSEVYAYARGLLLSIDRNIKALPSAQPEIIHCKECKYGVQDEDERWYCRGFGCQVGEEDGSGFCADAERRTDGLYNHTDTSQLA